MQDKGTQEQKLELVVSWLLKAEAKAQVRDFNKYSPRRVLLFSQLPVFLANKRKLKPMDYAIIADGWQSGFTSEKYAHYAWEKADYLVAVAIYEPDNLEVWLQQLREIFARELCQTSEDKQNWGTILGFIKGLFDSVQAYMDLTAQGTPLDRKSEATFIANIMEVLRLLGPLDLHPVKMRDALDLIKNHFNSWLSACVKDIFDHDARAKGTFGSNLILALNQELKSICHQKGLNQLTRLILNEIAYAGFGLLLLEQKICVLNPSIESKK